ncbi:Fc.00g104380.m01.CDS01 [Cosmosporella sp. VM-42]
MFKPAVLLAGPEQDIEKTREGMKGIRWHVTGIGYGQRGSVLPEVITRVEAFNYNPSTFLWSLQRRAPLSSKCAGSPGKDLGYIVLCDDAYKQNSTSTSSS